MDKEQIEALIEKLEGAARRIGSSGKMDEYRVLLTDAERQEIMARLRT